MNAASEDFHGVWRLEEWSVQGAGDSWQPFGGQVDDYLCYHPEAWLSATLTRGYVFDNGGDRLTLTGEMGEAVDHLVWRRSC